MFKFPELILSHESKSTMCNQTYTFPLKDLVLYIVILMPVFCAAVLWNKVSSYNKISIILSMQKVDLNIYLKFTKP